MKPALRTVIAAISLSVAVSACAGDDTAAIPVEPIPSGANGAEVYQARCASCHGEDLRGTDKGPSQLSIVYEPNHHGDDAYRAAIRNGAVQHHWGFGNMPAVEDITDDQIELVIGYIRSQQETLGFER